MTNQRVLTEKLQRTILYLLKTDYSFFSEIVALIKPEYFDFPSYSKLFSLVCLYREKYKKLPTDTVLLDLIANNLEDDEDLASYEDDIELINRVDKETLEAREFILDQIEEFAKQSEIKKAIKKSVTLLKENKIGEIEQLIRKAVLVSRNVDLGQDYFIDIDDRLVRFHDRKSEDRFKTPFTTVNGFLEGGNSRKELCMVLAPPGVGKSLYLVNQGAIALTENRNVLYVSLEMSEDKIANRFDSVLTLLNNMKLKEKHTQFSLKERLKIFHNKFNSARLIIKELPAGFTTPNHLRALLTQLDLHQNFKPDIIIVDYLELMRPVRAIEAEYAAQEAIAQELRGVATEQRCLMWTGTQTNRMGRKVAIITDAELGDSYGKIRPADFAISLNQTPDEYQEGKLRVYVVKARDSRQHYIIPATINYSNLRIEENRDAEAEEE